MKRYIRQLAQTSVSVIAPSLWSLRRTPRLLVLMYHRVLPADSPQRSTEQPGMYVSPETLAMHIDVLKRYFTLVHLDDWLRALDQGKRLPQLACALTFDDGWLDNYQHAYPVLKTAGAPATIYLVSDLVGTRYEFWPNRLVSILRQSIDERLLATLPSELATLVRTALGGSSAVKGRLDPDAIDGIVGRCKDLYTDAEIIAALDEQQSHSAPVIQQRREQRDLMDWPEIRTMAADDQIRFGSHSRRHTRLLSRVSVAETEDEVGISAQVIEEQLGKRPTTFCYPNGDFSAPAVAAVRQRYLAAVTTRRGWNTQGSDRFLLNRIGVHEDVSGTQAAFISRLAGIG